MDDLRWRSLNQLLRDISEVSFESKDLIRLLAQLVLELESEFMSLKTGNLPNQQEETFLTNRNEELE